MLNFLRIGQQAFAPLEPKWHQWVSGHAVIVEQLLTFNSVNNGSPHGHGFSSFETENREICYKTLASHRKRSTNRYKCRAKRCKYCESSSDIVTLRCSASYYRRQDTANTAILVAALFLTLPWQVPAHSCLVRKLLAFPFVPEYVNSLQALLDVS